MTQDTDHLRTIAKIYREHWGQDVVNAGYIDWAADEIERLRLALTDITGVGGDPKVMINIAADALKPR